MKQCPKCLNFVPDSALSCDQCGTVLDSSVIERARKPGTRSATLVETQVASVSRFTDVQPSPPPVMPTPPPMPAGAAASGRSPGRRGQTVFLPQSPADSPTSATQPQLRSDGRKIVGVLVTYSWKPEGQIFPVREGRNLIGRGEECEIRVPEDPALSQVNTHITCRQTFTVGDMVSMSGTDLNGEPVEEQFRPMTNYARIRTGSTQWIFIILDQSAAPPSD
jgi:hypothetical protein